MSFEVDVEFEFEFVIEFNLLVLHVRVAQPTIQFEFGSRLCSHPCSGLLAHVRVGVGIEFALESLFLVRQSLFELS